VGPGDLGIVGGLGHAEVVHAELARGEEAIPDARVFPHRKRWCDGQREDENVAVK
jgi:hypothetical protein